jgi:Anti-sigma-D factor RsdA to sigma factor binding region
MAMPDFGRWTNGGDPSLNEINRTDRFLDALANQQPVYSTDPSEAELAHLFAGWRDEIRTPPLMRPVTPRDATAALTRAVQARKRTRTSMAMVGSVAAAVLCIGGFGAVVASSGPGDALYGLHTALFGEQKSTRDDAVMLASQQLAEVQQLINEGQWDAAQDKLQTLTTTVATVNDVQQKEELVTQWQELTVKVDAKDANATLPPGAPPPPMPEPVVVAPGTDTSTTTSSETSGSTVPSSPSTETTTSSPGTTSSTTPTSAPTSSATTSNSPTPEPPPPSSPPTTTPPPVTTSPGTTTTTTHATTTTTTTPPAAPPIAGPPVGDGTPSVVGDAPAAGGGAPPAADGGPAVGGGAQVVAPPTTVPSEAPRQRGADSPATQSQEIEPPVENPVTTTLIVPPKKHGDGE